MKKFWQNKILILTLIFCILGCKKTTIEIPQGFIEIPPPLSEKERRSFMREKNLEVKFLNERLEVSEFNELPECEFEIEGGKLVGILAGGRHSKLVFISDDKSKKEIEIKCGKIRSIFSIKEKIYFIEGRQDMLCCGGLYELNRDKEKFSYKKILPLQIEPRVTAIFNEKVYLASINGLHVLDINRLKMRSLIDKKYRSIIWFSSLAILDEENIFLGFNGGIAKVNSRSKSVKFYKKENKFRF